MKAKFIGKRDEDFYAGGTFQQDGYSDKSALIVTSKPERRRNALVPTDWAASPTPDPNTGAFVAVGVVSAGDLSAAQGYFSAVNEKSLGINLMPDMKSRSYKAESYDGVDSDDSRTVKINLPP